MLFDELAKVTGNEQVGPNLYLMTLRSPRVASDTQPGQFVHMLIAGDKSHVLRRPFSVYATDKNRGLVDILYQVVGEGTEEMTHWGFDETTALIAPIGTPWQPPEGIERALLVGGGVGAAPLYMLCNSLLDNGIRVDVVLGASNEACLVCLDRYEELENENLRVICATDDGSYGIPGFCTSVAESALAMAEDTEDRYGYVATCGPEPMMRIVADAACDADVFCQVSLERRMACGIGACLSCVVDTTEGKKRACVDGPIFDARRIVW